MRSPACGSDDILRYNGRLSAICKLGNWPSIQLKCIGQVGGGSQWPGWGWVSVVGLEVVSVVGVGVGLSGLCGGGSQWPSWGWVSVVGMGWVSVVGMGLTGREWVGLSGRGGVGLSGRHGVGLSGQDEGGSQW